MSAQRAIGTIESTFLLLHDHFAGAYTGALAVEITGPLAPEHVRRALSSLVRRHPLLRAHIVLENGAPHFRAPDHVDFERALSFGELPTDPARVLEEDIAAFAPDDPLLWRARLLSDQSGTRHLFVLAAHHAIADALSLFYLIKGVLAACGEQLRGEEVETPASLALLPSIERLADAAKDVKRDWGQTLKIAGAHLGPADVRFEAGSPARAKTSLVSGTLDEDAVARILAACRAQKTPLTGLIAAALCDAVDEVMAGSGDFLVACPMSARALSRKVRLDDTQFGCYTRVGYVHSPKAKLWARAAFLSERLDVMSKAAGFQMNPRFRGASRVFRAWSSLPRFGFTDLAVSNLGIVDFPSAAIAPLKVEHLHLAANLNGTFEMFLLASCIFQKRLSLGFAFPEPHMARGRAHAVYDALTHVLETVR